MRFWDSSALIKLYVREPDSTEFKRFAHDSEVPLISSLTIHEVHCAFWGKELSGAVQPGAAETLFQRFLRQIDAADFKLVLYDSRVKYRATGVVRHCYSAAKPVMIRSLDALQIASALEGGATEMVSADSRMRNGGILFGLRILPE
ncbi:MAG TPA: type II toxin-antitoxin system VapC family toxin [Candidatus Udaeobacter sp.]|nr:type II toxin-antitoxin system VapC family toxin [Candidatus Udaeobacter sp.]